MRPKQLKEKREAMGLTQLQLAEELGVDVMTVSRYERGKNPIPRYISLAVEALELRLNRKAAA